MFVNFTEQINVCVNPADSDLDMMKGDPNFKDVCSPHAVPDVVAGCRKKVSPLFLSADSAVHGV